MKRNILEKVIHKTLAFTIWDDNLSSKDLKPLGLTRSGKVPTWEIGLPDKKDDEGFVIRSSAVYYEYSDYINDVQILELK
jgi:hypothetical protein